MTRTSYTVIFSAVVSVLLMVFLLPHTINANHCAAPLVHSPNGLCVPPSGPSQSSPPTDFAGLVSVFTNLVNILIPAVFAVVFVFFVWKIIDSWIINEKIEEGKQYVLWTVLLFALMISAWGIVVLLQDSFF